MVYTNSRFEMMERITILNIEWNCYNAIIIELLAVNDRALFGINVSTRFLMIDLFWFNIIVFDK